MEIIKNSEGDKLTITLKGRLDAVAAPGLEKELNASLNGVKELIFDFASLDYVSSAGLRTILVAQKRMNKQGSLVIKNISDEVYEVFEMTGFSDMIDIER